MTKFKIDENLPAELCDLLRASGHDSATVVDQSHGGRPDAFLMEVCSREGRTLVTLDTDFGDIRKHPPEGHRGVILLRLTSQDKEVVLRVFGEVVKLLRSEPVDQRLWVVDEAGVRIRDPG